MKLVLVRHAEAEALHASDAERALTARGHLQAQKTAQWLQAALQGQSVQLLASPYVRAQQTAVVLASALGVTPRAVNDVTPDVDPRLALRAIDECREAFAEADVVVVVTHMPLVAALAAWLESGVLSTGRGFMLAEARILEAELLAAATARVCDQFFPDVV